MEKERRQKFEQEEYNEEGGKEDKISKKICLYATKIPALCTRTNFLILRMKESLRGMEDMGNPREQCSGFGSKKKHERYSQQPSVRRQCSFNLTPVVILFFLASNSVLRLWNRKFLHKNSQQAHIPRQFNPVPIFTVHFTKIHVCVTSCL
jgi:hypothetical protein